MNFFFQIVWPIFQRISNSSQWPELLVRNCSELLWNLNDSLMKIDENVDRKTSRLFPEQVEFLNRPDYLRIVSQQNSHREQIRILENFFVNWQKNLRSNIEIKQKINVNSMPVESIEFWAKRALNLRRSQEQVRFYLLS